MKTTYTKRIILMAILIMSQNCRSQGFVNLDFEDATVMLDTSSPYYPYAVYADSAIPGWTAYLNGNSQSVIGYNSMALGAGGVFLEDTHAIYGPLPVQGNYSVFLQGSVPAASTSASIGQTGTIPSTAQSLTFIGNLGGTFQVTFNGQNIPFNAIGSGANYTIYGANIASYAGQTGQLLFTAPIQNSALL